MCMMLQSPVCWLDRVGGWDVPGEEGALVHHGDDLRLALHALDLLGHVVREDARIAGARALAQRADRRDLQGHNTDRVGGK